jgi:hypothetical protein
MRHASPDDGVPEFSSACYPHFMRTVGVFDAKSHLSELIDSGEPITITKHGDTALQAAAQRAGVTLV